MNAPALVPAPNWVQRCPNPLPDDTRNPMMRKVKVIPERFGT